MAKISDVLQKIKALSFPLLILLISFSYSMTAQIITNSGVVLPENSVKNYRLGLNSDNEGIIMSCVYYAGKYQLNEFCEDLINIVEKSENIEISKMAVWSLYQIGDISACKKLKIFLEEHPNSGLLECSKFLEQIQKYDKEVLETIDFAGIN